MAKECSLNTGKLALVGLPRNSVVRITDLRITDRPDMTSAVYCGCKATNLTNKQTIFHDQISRKECVPRLYNFFLILNSAEHEI